MDTTIHTYSTVINETQLDSFGHVNNAAYLTILEQARWDLMNKNNYGLQKIRETGLGPTILEINIRYMRELHARDEIVIQTQLISYQKKIGRLQQKIFRGEQECCIAEFVIALFSVKERKLVMPTEEWLKAIS